jgi:hypothetical protein
MRQTHLAIAAALVLSASAVVRAQLPGGRGSSMGVGRSPGRDDPALKEIGPELELRLANGVNIIIAHGRELSLTPEQLSRVVVIKRRLDSLNTPLMRELDSLEHAKRTRDPVQRSRGDLPDPPNPVLEQTLGDLRTNLHNAEQDAYDVLSGTQAQRAMQMVKEARANAAMAVGRDQSDRV